MFLPCPRLQFYSNQTLLQKKRVFCIVHFFRHWVLSPYLHIDSHLPPLKQIHTRTMILVGETDPVPNLDVTFPPISMPSQAPIGIHRRLEASPHALSPVWYVPISLTNPLCILHRICRTNFMQSNYWHKFNIRSLKIWEFQPLKSLHSISQSDRTVLQLQGQCCHADFLFLIFFMNASSFKLRFA